MEDSVGELIWKLGDVDVSPASRIEDARSLSGLMWASTFGLIRSHPMEGLKIRNSELSSGWRCIVVEGEVDLATVAELESAIESVFASNSDPLVIDLRASSFMDSTGLKALVMAHRRFDENGRSFAVAVSGGPVSRLLDLSGVETSVRIVENTDDLESHS